MKKLTLSESNRKIAGVCGGIAEYLNVDPTVVRVIWIIGTLVWGAGLLAYLLCWLFIPKENPNP